MSRIPVGNSLENPSQSVSNHTIMPLMSSCIQTHHQYPQPTGYENQWNRSYQQNMGTYFVSILYYKIIFSYYLFYYLKAFKPSTTKNYYSLLSHIYYFFQIIIITMMIIIFL